MTILERDKPAVFETRSEPISVKFIIGETIARGKFGIVKKLTDRSTGAICAGKFVRRGDVKREVDLLSEVCNHEYIIGLEMFYTSPKCEMVIVMELAINGDIFKNCVGERATFSEEESKELTRQLAQALDFIHKRYIVHLDVKPQNILLAQDGSCRLADFGLSRKIMPGEVVQEICGTPEYTAPEILNYNPITTAADLWSLGAVLYVMLTGYSPFAGESLQETYLNVAKACLSFPDDEWSQHSPDSIELIESLCVERPGDRLSAADVLNQKWLRNDHQPCAAQEDQPIVRRMRRRSRKKLDNDVKQLENNQSGDSDSGVSLADDDDNNRAKKNDFFARREERRQLYLQAKLLATTAGTTTTKNN